VTAASHERMPRYRAASLERFEAEDRVGGSTPHSLRSCYAHHDKHYVRYASTPIATLGLASTPFATLGLASTPFATLGMTAL
jgi:hypothetical protein